MSKEIDSTVTRTEISLDFSDHIITFETVLVLLKDQALLGFFMGLLFLHKLGVMNFTSQKHLSKILGMSNTTFLSKRNDLVKIGLLEVLIKGNTRIYKFHFPRRVQKLDPLKNATKAEEWLDKLRDSLWYKDLESGDFALTTDNIYKGEGFFNLAKYNIPISSKGKNVENSFNNIHPVKEKLGSNKEVVKRLQKVPSQKKPSKRFPETAYNKVLKAYFKYSGVVRKGSELVQPRAAIRTMFHSGRTADEIISFMKWISENVDNKKYDWLKYWTMWTVQKRLPDFLAGKLQQDEEKGASDVYRRL